MPESSALELVDLGATVPVEQGRESLGGLGSAPKLGAQEISSGQLAARVVVVRDSSARDRHAVRHLFQCGLYSVHPSLQRAQAVLGASDKSLKYRKTCPRVNDVRLKRFLS